MTHLDLHAQWMTVLLMLFSGLALGIAYDSYRVVAHQLGFPRWTLPCLDIVYWLAATWFVFQLLVKGNQGELRFYVFLGLALGAWLYYILLSRMTITLTTWIVNMFKAIVRFLLRVFHVVLVLPTKTLILFLWATLRFIGKAAMFILKFVLKLAQPLWWLVRWMLSPLIMPLWNRWQMTAKIMRVRDKIMRAAHSVSTRWNRVKIRCVGIYRKVLGWFKRPPDTTN
ncbi:spore cortex biosynthesis protein YabQ [Paenibacillus marinisediminis]